MPLILFLIPNKYSVKSLADIPSKNTAKKKMIWEADKEKDALKPEKKAPKKQQAMSPPLGWINHFDLKPKAFFQLSQSNSHWFPCLPKENSSKVRLFTFLSSTVTFSWLDSCRAGTSISIIRAYDLTSILIVGTLDVRRWLWVRGVVSGEVQSRERCSLERGAVSRKVLTGVFLGRGVVGRGVVAGSDAASGRSVVLERCILGERCSRVERCLEELEAWLFQDEV